MKRKNKVLFSLGMFFVWTLVTLWAGLHFSGTGSDVSVANVADDIVIHSATGTLQIFETDQTSSAYAWWERLTITWNGVMLVSEQYGDFNHAGGLKFYKAPSVHTNCNAWETVSYTFWGNTQLTSIYWGTVNITGWYYCPGSQKFRMNIWWPTIGNIYVENTTWWSASLVFNNRKVMISWVTNAVDISSTTSEYTTNDASIEQANNFVALNANLEGSILNLNATVNKNIVSLTKGKNWLTTTNHTNSFDGKNFYYDYRGTQNSSPSNEQNRGKILELWTVNVSSQKIPITGENTLIVQWGNLYIKNDIYNTNTNSILTIIVKRDEGERRKNGWNVYIDPSVTNIDAVIIADGSILNYNGSSVVTKASSPNTLRRQLLIYWALSTKNTLSEGTTPYGSDASEAGITDTNTYSLSNLRTFQLMWNTNIPSGNTCATGNKITAMGNSNTSAQTYAFAGKKQCFADDSQLWDLRTTQRYASVVIEYNPLLQTKPPRVLQK